MKLLDLFQREQRASAGEARERLKIILAHERSLRSQPEFLPRLQQDLLEVVKRYVSIQSDQVRVQLDRHDMMSVLEINVTFPNTALSGGVQGGGH
ncbi:cell division topological specificity factor MinE [Marinospirillum alkaliphilum]|uniref:Cell division topological specificity factor n=1 Tax=Marinospirillum alkaliphilum DSM 21637 TaxID=1122209 RepID=A0A1K1ZVB4_9GAMM|nr:cell division topological specificity factor MinE [Marinospirillum alkaliphilum]SFX77691.1 cell division topological specificity factor MinE [Marinospirillum alkaliphilum DSM 21637]